MGANSLEMAETGQRAFLAPGGFGPLSGEALLRALWPPALLSLICGLGAQVNYLVFHTLAELFSVVVAFSALVVASTAMRYTRHHFVVLVSVAIGWCAGLDVLHTLAFKGMHLLPTDSANPATQLWVGARLLQAAALVIAPLLLFRPVSIAWAHLGFGSAAATLAALVLLGCFPDAYIDDEGLTTFKIHSEYLIIALLGLSAGLLWQRRSQLSPPVLHGMLIAIVTMMASEFSFTQYVSVYADANLIGHLLKIFAYWFVYLALVRNTVHEPFVRLQGEIRERERLGREREEALHDLGERIKELTCINAVSELVKQPDLPIVPMLQGVVDRLPPAFLRPALAQARIESDWGDFGTPAPADPLRRGLSQALRVDDREVGRISVWYPEDEAAGTSFLPEEATLLRNVSHQVGEAIQRLKAQERIQRLRYLYEMLSATNRSVVFSQTREELLRGLFKALTAHATFPVLFVAETGGEPPRWTLKAHHGVTPAQFPLLSRLLDAPDSPLLRELRRVSTGDVFSEPLPHPSEGGAVGDGAGDGPGLAQWRNFLREQGLTQRAILPLMCRGALRGVVALYARGLAAFDAEQLQLLNEIAGDMAFALDNLEQRELLRETSQQAQLLELRFQEVFRASPVPMMIMDLERHQIRAINDAHHAWLGYAIEDIATEDDWFRRIFPSAEVREALRTEWEAGLAQGREGQTILSPELQLRCKDGSMRTARGTMTIVGNDAIIAWTDLTEIRQNEQELRESERRFRHMVEQSLTGMYVRRDGKYIYVNPRYAELTGWAADALIGKDVLEFTDSDPANLGRIREAWAKLHDGRQQTVSYVVPCHRGDGQCIQLGLTAREITWDDGLPATIVMAGDITERRRAEERIAAYVKQLEGAMEGTLRAVSTMIDMRDPYTAGHMRRVGAIARGIAQEMGWSDERCQNLELVGLVHDIGKIAVPSEILTKPTRLSRLEMEMMKGHAQAGFDILKDVPFASPIAEIILQHHERLDGSGYPRGLKGDEILAEARVLAVADVIESMASHRPYRAAVGLEAALGELDRNRGTQYAAEVVDAAIRLIREKRFVLPN